MKHLKSILFLCALALLVSATTHAQPVFVAQPVPSNPGPAAASRGNYGTIQFYTYTQASIWYLYLDTLRLGSYPTNDTGKTAGSSDTLYFQWSNNLNVNHMFDLAVTNLTGTQAGTAILQGSLDNATWNTITGNTTYCTTCTGASATISGSGTTHYKWDIPANTTPFPYWQVRVIQTGTCTATYNAYDNKVY